MQSFALMRIILKIELAYEAQGCTRVANCHFCHLCYDNVDIDYCDTCQNSQNLFGCISVKKGKYMIFNKKYSKEKYEKLKEEIIEHMKKTGEYGEFFPPQIAPVYYNETQGQLYEPMTKEKVLSLGWHWEEKVPGTFGRETLLLKNIPDRISDVDESIIKEVLKCINCSKNYNLTSYEFSFYKKEKIPVPRLCFDCRYRRDINLRPPRKLWSGKCKCSLSNHFHGVEKCEVKFETTYAPGRPEKVYCEKCYQAEVY